ncbi:unnamed protein product [Prorocentrum cordatum]|uniref:Uncharacterized protein n=1 Tax=Prorocentrum cordatum TaxID=2364126 RepID=A0ABN9QTU9_9DINO|nr:unnamed protein product [Polarella glacialis]
MLPPLLVEDHPESLESAEREMTRLMQFQLGTAFVSLVVTAVLYQDPPARSAAGLERPEVPFHQELLAMLSLRDFWVVNGQFAVYVALGHAFDAVEGTLLEHYGYSASVASWTALACAITSILSTLLEAKYIDSPTMYKSALLIANGCLVAALLIGFLSLHFRMDERWFIAALAIFGLATPGWGCSCELGAEVCYPAREATVSSFMEAFGNLLGVFGIMATQSLIDAGYGANVLLLMAACAGGGAAMLLGLSGRLWRSEAEAEEEEAPDGQDVQAPTPKATRSPRHSAVCDVSKQRRISPRCQQVVAFATSRTGLALPEPLRRISGGRATFIVTASVIICSLPLLQFGHVTYQPELHEFTRAEYPGLAVSSALPALGPGEPGSINSTATNGTAARGGLGVVLANGFPEPVNVVIHCAQDTKKLQRFTKRMREANLSFEVFDCFTGSAREVSDAVRARLLPSTALGAVEGVTRAGLARKTLIGKAISHLRLMRKISSTSGWRTVNVFQDSEAMQTDFRWKRNALLGSLPRNTDFVNLNTLRPAGDRAFGNTKLPKNKSWMMKHVFRMKQGLSPFTNGWLGNYVVTKRGVKRMMTQGSTYDTFGKWQTFEQHVFAQYPAPRMAGFVGFSVSSGVMSVRCEMRHGKFAPRSARMCALP